MNSKTLAIATTALTLFMVSPAIAAPVYDNGPPDANDGNDATQWVQSEDFSFGADTTLGGAGVYIAGFGGIDNYDGSFTYFLFDDAGGIPGATLQSGLVLPTITDSGTPWCCGGNAFLFEFAFNSNFNALAGQTYHLGFHASSDFDRDDIYWVTTAFNSTAVGIESDQGTFDNWAGNGNEHAFFLNGAGRVPEPAAWAMLILGMGTVGAAMRRRKQAMRVSFA